MSRFLVTFRSHAEGLSDLTFLDVKATSELRAIARAKKLMKGVHPWASVSATPWPVHCLDVDAVAKLALTS